MIANSLAYSATSRLEGTIYGLNEKNINAIIMVKISVPTAKREIIGLVDYGLIKQIEGSAGIRLSSA